MAGLLDFDALDPSQYQVSDEERKKIIFQNLMFQLAPALAGSRKGELLQGAAFGLTNGAMAAQQGLAGAQQGKYDKLKMGSALMDYQGKKQAYEDENQYRAAAAGYQPSAPQLPDMAPTPENAAKLSTQGSAYEKALAKVAYLQAKGVAPKYIEKAQAEAEKLAPQYDGTEVQFRDGKPVVLQKYKNQAPTVTEYQPPPKFREVQRGGSVDVINDYNLPASGQSFTKTMTPEGVQTGEHWLKDYQLRLNADQRAARDGGPKPQLVDNQWVFPPDKSNPGGRAVPVTGMTPKQEKPSDQQLATGGFLDRMQSATKVLNEVEKKYTPGFDQTSVNAMKGLPLIGGPAGYLAESTRNATGPNAAMYNNAQEAWIRAKLRKESGAVISEDEMIGEKKTFFPQPNDPPELVAQKKVLRREVEKSMEKQARGGYQGGGAADPLGIR